MRDCLNSVSNISRFILSATLAVSLALNGTQALSASSSQPPTFIRGSIGDGPVVKATLLLYDRNGVYISNQRGTALGNYVIRVNTRPAYPLQIIGMTGKNLITGKPLDYTATALSLTPLQPRTNLNIYSTLIVSMARTMNSGLTPGNLAAATTIAVREFNFGLQTQLVPDPMRTAITPLNIATLVRASEALAEVIRRTQKALAQASYWRTENYIINALAADLRDGRLDGRGGIRTDGRVSATVTVVSAQVLVEGLQNRLYVNGTLATPAMDKAIRTVLPATKVFTDSVTIPQAMLTQTKKMLSAARQIDSRQQLNQLAESINRIPAGSRTVQVRNLLNDNHSRLLNTSVALIARAPHAKLQAVNNLARSGIIIPTYAAKPALTISGTPSASVTAGSGYSFAPSVVATGTNRISFTITNKPKWATFNTATGRLSGTPGSADVATYSNIIIRVSDGRLGAALKGFSVKVNGALIGTTNRTVRWVAPRTRADGRGISLSEIAGYRIRYGTTPGRYTHWVIVNNGSTSYKLPKLKSGTYYFVVTTIDSAGLESQYSSTAAARF